MALLSLPPELLLHTFALAPLPPSTLLNLALTCHYLNSLIMPDSVLWRNVCRGLWDECWSHLGEGESERVLGSGGWKGRVKEYCEIKKWIKMDEEDEEKLQNFDQTMRVLLRLLRTTPTYPHPSKNIAYIESLFSEDEVGYHQFYFLRNIISCDDEPLQEPKNKVTFSLERASVRRQLQGDVELSVFRVPDYSNDEDDEDGDEEGDASGSNDDERKEREGVNEESVANEEQNGEAGKDGDDTDVDGDSRMGDGEDVEVDVEVEIEEEPEFRDIEIDVGPTPITPRHGYNLRSSKNKSQFSVKTSKAELPIHFPTHIPLPDFQLRSQVHVLLGPNIQAFKASPFTESQRAQFELLLNPRSDTLVIAPRPLPYRGTFREIAYNLTRYSVPEFLEGTKDYRHHRYSPLSSDGGVNWKLLEGQWSVMWNNAAAMKGEWMDEVRADGGLREALKKLKTLSSSSSSSSRNRGVRRRDVDAVNQEETSQDSGNDSTNDSDWELDVPPSLDTRRRGTTPVNVDREFISALKSTEKFSSESGKGKKRAEWCDPDWAGVEAIWIGSYAFLDYRIFHAFNFHGQPVSRSPEAVGNLMAMKLTLVECPQNKPIPPDRQNSNSKNGYGNDYPNAQYPTLYFEGVRRPFGRIGENIKTHGCVRLTKQREGEGLIPHWTFVVGYGGEDRWRLEGIQPGGIGSRSGVVGNWSSAEEEDYIQAMVHQETPVGPFAYWPIYENV